MAKTVCILYCKYCRSSLTNRGMRAILLGDTNVELYSTDLPPSHACELVGEVILLDVSISLLRSLS
jgi:hypothetical protein